MGQSIAERPVLITHGAKKLPSVEVDSYNLELRDEDGFVGDKASRGAFHAMLEKWREPLRKLGVDPLGEKPAEQLDKKKLDKLLIDGDPEAGGIIHSAVEEFAQALTFVIKRFLKVASWRDTQAIVIGGGFRASRVGELAAGNIRAGIVETKLKKAKDLSKASVYASDLWRHGDEKTNRDDAVGRLVEMLKEHIALAEKDRFKLAPVVGIGCPGLIREDGSMETGAQNLPGNWESSRFNLGRSRDQRRDPQRRGRAGPERAAQDAGVRALGCADDRYRARQRTLHEPP